MSATNGRRNYFGKEILILKILGVSLTGNDSLPYKIYSFLFVTPTLFIYPVLSFYEYFKHDPRDIGEIVVYQIASFLGFCKVAVILRKRIKFKKLLDKLEREPFIPNLERGGHVEEKLVGECVRITGAQTLFFGGFTCVTVISPMIYCLVRRMTSNDFHDWEMPFGPFTLLNGTYSPGYEINCIYQSISYFYIATTFTTIDFLLAAVLAHITYQFKLVQKFLKRTVENGHKNMMKVTNRFEHQPSTESTFINETDSSNIPWEYLKKPAAEAIQYHIAIVDVAKEIDEVYSDLLLIVFLGTLCMICFSTYAASSAPTYQSAAIRVGEALVACFQVATVCFWGEQVFQESQLVGNAAYDSNFVGTDLRFQKMLALIIRRSQNPTRITAGKFADICLATFAWILRASYSAFMLLRKTNI